MKSNIFLAIATGLLVMFLISGCGLFSTPISPTSTPVATSTPAPTATPIIYNTIIKIVDEKGNSIPEAKIIIGESVNLTDNQGIWKKSENSSELMIDVWAQGYQLLNYESTLQPGDNSIQIQLTPDSNSLNPSDLIKEGYELVFIEDFQDGISDCEIDGNGNIFGNEDNPENLVLSADLRNLDDVFSCYFGPVNIENAVIEVDFYYPEIRYYDYVEGGEYHWQGYFVDFRDKFNVEGYPLLPPGGSILQIRDYTDDEWKFPIQVQQRINEKQWYTLNTKYDGKRVEVRLNDSLKFTYLNPPTMTNSSPASIGGFSQAYIEFDNIKMWVPIE